MNLPVVLMLLSAAASSPAAVDDTARVSATQMRFHATAPDATLFPSDVFTRRASENLTGRRIHLPLPDCTQRPSDCALLRAVNTLDGFNVGPRLSLPFSGPIDIATLDSRSVFLIPLSEARPRAVGIERLVWDAASSTAHVESRELLAQHSRYALIVTTDVRGGDGRPLGARPFREFRRTLDAAPPLAGYAADLRQALRAATRHGLSESRIAGASVFTTQSVTAVLEKIRAQLDRRPAPRADFHLNGPGVPRTVYSLDSIAEVRFALQQRTDIASPDAFLDLPVYTHLLGGDAVATLAFGRFRAPGYRRGDDLWIPPVGTRSGEPRVHETHDVFFNLIVPQGPKPAGGWPVAIYGHGSGPGKNFDVFLLARALARRGVAVIAVNAVGFGGGPRGTLTLTHTGGRTVTLPGGGQGFDVDGDGAIAAGDELDEGYSGARLPITRDGQRQTAVDLMQLVRVIRAGIDVDGDGARDLDPAHVSYVGGSLGGYYGTIFLAVEPNVRVGVLNTPGASDIDQRLSVVSRPAIEHVLAAWQPPLTNVGDPRGCTSDGPCDRRFEESLPLRGEPAMMAPAPGALAIQEGFERIEWLSQSGNPEAYAVHLRARPLPSLPRKAILVQMARGDRDVPNPSTSALIRAGRLAGATTLYRHDLVFGNPDFPGSDQYPDGHPFAVFFPWLPGLAPVGQGAQTQLAEFVASSGRTVLDPDGAGPIFEVPVSGPLPETCGFVAEVPGFTSCR